MSDMGHGAEKDAGLTDLLRAHGSRIGPVTGSWTCPPPCDARSRNGSIHDGNLTSHKEREEQRIAHLTDAILNSEWFKAQLAQAWDAGHRLARPHSDYCEPTCPNPYDTGDAARIARDRPRHLPPAEGPA